MSNDKPCVVEQEERFDRMNLTVLVAQFLGWLGSILALTHTDNVVLSIVVVTFFCFMMQGVFSMMHESFHGHAHTNSSINYLISWFSSTLFGASATLIGINHLGHHVRNRTRAELVDYVEPDESRVKKTISYYLAIFGGIWLMSSAGSLLLAMTPLSLIRRLRLNAEFNTYAAAMSDFTVIDFKRIRYEIIAGVLFWVCIWNLFDFQWRSVVVLYIGFALSWSSLQWVYHVRTPLDVVEGTYNVRASWWVRYLFLNFNYNLTHHRQPALRWQLMHTATDLRYTRPFWYVWLSILRPPVQLPNADAITKTYF